MRRPSSRTLRILRAALTKATAKYSSGGRRKERPAVSLAKTKSK